MSRLVIPRNFAKQFELLVEIKAKHDADGPASVLHPLLAENEIDLDEGMAAHLHDDAHDNLSRETEKLREERNRLFEPAMQHLRGAFQYLKSLYPKNNRKLGDWGGTVNGRGRIVYPKDFSQRSKLFLLLYQKHQSYPPGTSPLDSYLLENEISMTADAVAVQQAVLRHEEFEDKSREKEREREAREAIWTPMLKNIRLIGGFLKSLFRNNPHQLGDWGFQVDSSPKTRKRRRTALGPKQSRTLRNIYTGTEMENLGPDSLELFRGKGKKGEAIRLGPGEKFVVARGFGILTVSNPSTKQSGLLSYFSS